MIVMFLSIIVAGNWGLAGKGQVSWLKVICREQKTGTSIAGKHKGDENIHTQQQVLHTVHLPGGYSCAQINQYCFRHTTQACMWACHVQS